MRIRFTRQIRGGYGAFDPGQEADLDAALAVPLIEAGAALPVRTTRETATLKPQEPGSGRRRNRNPSGGQDG
jgi:hypothetical protein